MNAITRREFLQRAAILGLSATMIALLDGCSILPGSTPTPKVFRIGVISGATRDAAVAQRIEAFRQGLRELGYVEGQNIIIEYRFAEGRAERYPVFAAEFVQLPVDVIVAVGDIAVIVKQATSTIPIVFLQTSDPVGVGLVESFAHPGGNITGLTSGQNLGITGKQLQLLKEAIPSITRVAIFWESAALFSQAQLAARALGIPLQSLQVTTPDDIERLLEAVTQEHAEALLVQSGPRLASRRPQFMELLAKSRLPAIFNLRDYVDDGGLMFYGRNLLNDWYRAATYVDKILKGAKPGDIPVENPTKFDFVINLKTAKTLGLTIPQSVLAQATEVIR